MVNTSFSKKNVGGSAKQAAGYQCTKQWVNTTSSSSSDARPAACSKRTVAQPSDKTYMRDNQIRWSHKVTWQLQHVP